MMLGKRGVGAAVLSVAAIVCYLTLLSTTPSGAQNGNEGCQNPEQIETFSGANSQITPSFEITGTTFLLTLDAEPVQAGEHASIFIESFQGESEHIPFGDISINPVDGPTTETANVLEGPGTFHLEIEANNTDYAITVDDCGGDNNGNGATNNNQNRTQYDDNNQNTVNQNRTTQNPNPPGPNPGPPGKGKIINVPDKPLPPSGGLPVATTVTVAVLLGVALLGLGLAIRRGTR